MRPALADASLRFIERDNTINDNVLFRVGATLGPFALMNVDGGYFALISANARGIWWKSKPSRVFARQSVYPNPFAGTFRPSRPKPR
jgi:hypothetical protein